LRRDERAYQAGGPSKSGTFRKIALMREGGAKRIVDLYDFLMNGSKKQDCRSGTATSCVIPPVGPTITVEGDVIRPARYEPTSGHSGAALKMAGG